MCQNSNIAFVCQELREFSAYFSSVLFGDSSADSIIISGVYGDIKSSHILAVIFMQILVLSRMLHKEELPFSVL